MLGIDREGLRARHAEPHRRYHTAEHVAEVRAEVERLLPHEPDADAQALWLAALYHDAIYDPRAGGGASEDASARLARADIRAAGGPPGLADEVARLVRLTALHEVRPDDRTGAVLVDADLWILSAPPERYERYRADVRAEYAHVDDDAWVRGRGGVLDRFASMARSGGLFTAGPDDDRAARHERALANITAELASLREA